MSSSSKSKTDAVKRKLFQYSPHKVGLALNAIRNGMKVSTASKNFNVPRTTLRHKLSGNAPETSGHVGPQAVLGIEIENELVEWIKDYARDGFPVSKEGLLDSVKKIVEKGNLKTPFVNNRPSRSWFEAFMARHPDVSQKHAEYINKARALITEEKIRNWFQEVSSLLGTEHLKVLEDPSRVWNCDETAFFLAPKGCLVLAEKGKHVYDTSKNSDKENITTLFTVNALGEYAPPLTVYKYKRMSSEVIQNSPDGWGVGKTEKGWMTGEAFYEYVGNVFIPYLKEKGVELPIILFLDGHKSHLTMQLSKLCRENGIIVVALVPNTTHMLQPLDVAVFYPLKQNWRKLVKKWRIEHDGKEITKFNLPAALHSLLINNETFANNIKAGFKTCGLYPFGPDFVNYKRIVKSPSDTRENHDVITKIAITESSHLTYLESKIDPNLIKVFKTTFESGKDWEGNKEALMLYETWLAFKNDNSATMTQTNQAVISEVDEDPCLSDTGENGERAANQENTCSEENPSEERCTSASLLDDTVLWTCTQNKDNSCNKEDPVLKEVSAFEEPSTSSSCLSTCDQEGAATETNSQNKHKLCNSTRKDDNPFEEPCVSSNHLVTCDQVNSALRTPKQKNTQDELQIEDPPCITSDHLDTCNQMDVTIPNEEIKKTSKQSATYSARELVRECVLYPGKEVPKKTRKAMYIPSVITSNKWRDIMEAAENEKRKKLVSKKKKDTKTQAKKKKISKEIRSSDEDGEVIKANSEEDGRAIKVTEDEKKKKQINKKKTDTKMKAKKKKVPKEISSSEEDGEVEYVESDQSIWNEQSDANSDANSNDEEMIDLHKHLRKGSKQRKRKVSATEDSSSGSETELPLSHIANSMASEKRYKNLKTGCYVIIKYEGEYFPGKVEKKEGGLYEISTMVLSTGNSFRWPERPDKIWYKINDIVEIISPPVKHNNRGFFKIVEMEKFLPDIYNI